MNKIITSLFGLFAFLGSVNVNAQPAATPSSPSILKNSQQLILVITNSWDSFEGVMQLFKRSDSNQSWKPASQSWPVVVGKKGIAWGDNFQNLSLPGPVKHEGDKKGIAGAFKIGSSFGFATTADNNLKLSYIPITTTIECVDDSNSRYYGKVVDNTKVNKDWNSSEVMSNYSIPYHQGIVVDYNTNGKMINGGSCIFLHIKAPSNFDGTAGCTAMESANLSTILNWVDPQNNPVLVQLPKEIYDQLKDSWGLPNINK